MADGNSVNVPQPNNPPPGYGPVGAVAQQIGWFGRMFAGMNDHQLQRVVLASMQFCTLFLIGFLMYRADWRQTESEQRHIEDMLQFRRDKADSEEKNRQDRIAVVGTVLKHCSDQDKIRRDEDALSRKDQAAAITKLADAVNNMTRKIAGIKDTESIPVVRGP